MSVTVTQQDVWNLNQQCADNNSDVMDKMQIRYDMKPDKETFP